ncbi:hypothetical protein [Actinokineospora globicatena]|uniref:Uncharacterized protein n=1 Tax=Actinokineospora globicatena TaxID=103729 RepID=A0A9W6QWC2_9PSEU|nr:hypothetical protein [Actinokineospora globicatena]GLW95769.1 hypothetical protein Aglo03_65850 [Actinokineospora globicatena]
MPSIHDHITGHLDPSGRGLLPGGDELPDAQIDHRRGGGLIPWSDGTALTHHPADVTTDLPALVAAAVTGGDHEPLYTALCEREVLAELDEVLAGVRALDLAGPVHDLGRRLATESEHRAPVKFGIALLGLGSDSGDVEVLLRLGRHEEFTLFAFAAVEATQADPEPALLALADGVEGWGRIGVVERLGDQTGPRLREWLLRGGFRNTVQDGYLAHRAATVGGLVPALSVPEVDDELLDAAADILCALIEGGPAEDIDDYADAPIALSLLVGHLTRRAHGLRHFVATARVDEFLAGPDWDRRYAAGWDLTRHDTLVRGCRDLMAEPRWRDLTLADLDSTDDRTFHDACYAAAVLGIDRFPATMRRVRTDATPADWAGLLAQATEERLPDILDIASDVLPLADLGTGPDDIAGIGARWTDHAVLDVVVTALREFPGQGVEFVLTSLRCPVVRNRVMAVRTLTGWGPESWQPDVQSALRSAVAAEPDPTVRESMAQLLTH